MMNPSQRITFIELNKRFQESSKKKKIEEAIKIHSELLELLKAIDLSQGNYIQKVIVEAYLQILIRIDFDPQSFKTSLNQKLGYAFDSLDRHFIS
jgi:hypothetical protein